MGSYRKAIMTGFICRLCSEHKSVVIHIYSKRAKNMALLDKITLLPITIRKNDRLPKTICEKCIENLCRQFDLVQQIKQSVEINMRHQILHGNGRCPVQCPLYGTEDTHDSSQSTASAADSSTEAPLPPVIESFADIVNHLSRDIININSQDQNVANNDANVDIPTNTNNDASNYTNS